MANKVIGSIPYSLGYRLVSPGDAESAKKIFATLQQRETVSLRLLAQHIREHGSSFSVGTLYGVLSDMVECTKELLKSGYAVDFEGLARFYLTCKSKGVEKDEDFNAATDITAINVRADVDSEATAYMNNDVDFEYVMTREEQQKAKKAAKAALFTGTDEGGGEGGDSDNPEPPEVVE